MKVLVAMSGGVDSSVAAKILTDSGHTCVGCTMKLYNNEDAGIPQGAYLLFSLMMSRTHEALQKNSVCRICIQFFR